MPNFNYPENFPERTQFLLFWLNSIPFFFAIGGRMNGLLLCSFRKQNRSHEYRPFHVFVFLNSPIKNNGPTKKHSSARSAGLLRKSTFLWDCWQNCCHPDCRDSEEIKQRALVRRRGSKGGREGGREGGRKESRKALLCIEVCFDALK